QRSGLGTGLLERAMQIGDGTGRGWRRWMAPEPPMPRKWWDLVEAALQRGWVSNQTAQELLDSAQASAGEQAPRMPSTSIQIVLPFPTPPAVPGEVLLLNPWMTPPDARSAARLLAGDAIQAARRAGAGLGSGGHKGARHCKWLEATPEGKTWLAAMRALRRTVERLGLADRPGAPGHPGADTVHARRAAQEALEEALQAAYQRLGYPPPPEA
ncbi:hypothetical protein, partial [Thiomonas sp. 13-64-67]|uniref:hypothetical protein n=2 Tax=unclassified Thiomonas TaxID=2625466 RepID=UPI00258054F1